MLCTSASPFVLLGLFNFFYSVPLSACFQAVLLDTQLSGCAIQLDMGDLVSAPCSEEIAECQLWAAGFSET